MKKSIQPKEIMSKSGKNVSQILKVIMDRKGIRESDIVRNSGLSQQRCNRIINGLSENPRANTLVALSRSIGVTVGQLVGTEPLEDR
jgi:transcriptional regulator with XRE-family HTH domain